MKTVAAKLYEGLFLVDSALAASDWQGVNDTIRAILEKAGAEIVSMDKWDERKLAYDIRGKSRGTYILTYFRVDGTRITQIERAALLSENIMRLLVLSVEDLDEQYIIKKTSVAAEKTVTPEETQKSDDTNDRQSTGRLTAEPLLAETEPPVAETEPLLAETEAQVTEAQVVEQTDLSPEGEQEKKE